MMRKVKNICVVTGTRADYGIYHPLLAKLHHHPFFEMAVMVTGMHLSPEHGFTFEEVKRDGFPIIGTVDTIMLHQNDANMSRGIGLGLLGMTQIFERNRPDLVVVLGDRGEMLAAAIAAIHLNIAVMHLHGGERSGSIDESIRHAISKLAHLHFPATKQSANRLKRLGEDLWRIHPVGALRIESMLNQALPNFEDVMEKHKLPLLSKEYYLFIFHPVTYEWQNMQQQTESIMNVLLNEHIPIICILPNTDTGAGEILKCYQRFSGEDHFFMIKNFQHNDYLTVLKHARALIGNSSSGIIEAASFHIPVLNIGSRQSNRERSANVIDSTPEKEDLENALEMIKNKEFQKKVKRIKNVYGKGNTTSMIIKTLEETFITPQFIAKTNSY